MAKAKKGKKKVSHSSSTTSASGSTATTAVSNSSCVTTTNNSTSNWNHNNNNGTVQKNESDTILENYTLNRDIASNLVGIMNNSNDGVATMRDNVVKRKGLKGLAGNKCVQENSCNSISMGGGGGGTNGNGENDIDGLQWLRECEVRHASNGEPYLQLEYQEDDELIILLHKFLEESKATKETVEAVYQIWQKTVLNTLLESSVLWKKETISATDQRMMKEILKLGRYKVNFILHHLTGSMLTSNDTKWKNLRETILTMCYNTLLLVPRLAESCPHSPTDIRLVIIHFESKEFLAAVACETWDTLYDFAIQIDASKFIPVLRRCAMLDILDKDWNMLGGWEDILKGIEAKCCRAGCIQRLPSDAVLHEKTTILRNARNSMQCKFFSVRFMRYTEDQAPQRWRYFPKCSAPACANIETSDQPHPYRCRKCWYFHYCSAACQEYCDNIMGLHPKFCKDTPVSKLTLCRKETEQYLGWGITSTTKDVDKALPSCHACGAIEDETSTTTSTIKRCQHCESVSYCSRQCQEWDWKVGGHRQECGQNNIHDNNLTEVVIPMPFVDHPNDAENAKVAAIQNGSH